MCATWRAWPSTRCRPLRASATSASRCTRPIACRLVADRGELEILFNNLVSNAVKYNREGGRVDVTVDEAGGGLRVVVADTGIGLTPEEAARLFQEFVRIKNDRTRGIAGTGLGLSIVKKLAQLYGGDVHVQSQPGVGSTFEVTLPQAKPAVTLVP